MFKNAIILNGSNFWETAATQICGRPKGISLTSLYQRLRYRRNLRKPSGVARFQMCNGMYWYIPVP